MEGDYVSTNDELSFERLLIDEVQLLLDEKRAFLSLMRTGIFILIAQLLIISILIATSRFYEIISVLHMIIPFYALNIALALLGCYLIIHAFFRLRHYDYAILQLKKKHRRIAELVD
jgi:membrane protein YdbS with pleckstrin-like domain